MATTGNTAASSLRAFGKAHAILTAQLVILIRAFALEEQVDPVARKAVNAVADELEAGMLGRHT